MSDMANQVKAIYRMSSLRSQKFILMTGNLFHVHVAEKVFEFFVFEYPTVPSLDDIEQHWLPSKSLQ
jgi:hypothetical protein